MIQDGTTNNNLHSYCKLIKDKQKKKKNIGEFVNPTYFKGKMGSSHYFDHVLSMEQEL